MKSKNQIIIIFTIIILGIISISCTKDNLKHTNHKDHLAKINEQGDKAMGFSHNKTKHKFILLNDGGAIQVKVNDANDTESLKKVRKHLNEIQKMFSEGNFEHPIATHGGEPTGVSTMKKLKEEIEYKFEQIENGGRVRITTKNKKALYSVHDFLKFQIEDHQTDDSKEISNEPKD